MRVQKHVFRAYDIRGLAGEEISPEFAFHVGRAAGTWVRARNGDTLAVGRDARATSEELCGALCRGAQLSGCDVIDLGLTPTPVGYWTQAHLRVHGVVHVTASHNPAEYNGFKLTLGGQALSDQDLQDLRRTIEAEAYAEGAGNLSRHDPLPAYLDDVVKGIRRGRRRLRLAVDAGNGVGGLTVVPVLERLGHEVRPLFCDVDPRFPNHPPDPSVEENLAVLRDTVRRERLDLGLAVDGDGDRLIAVDAEGGVLWGDMLLIVLARQVLAEAPGATVVGEVKCSRSLFRDVTARGGRAIMERAGHSFIKRRMRSERAQLGGEMSGHIFFADRYHGFDDATYAAARLLEVLAATDAGLAELLRDLPPSVSTPEVRVPCPEERKSHAIRALAGRYRDEADRHRLKLVEVDGVRLEWGDGFGLVRPSNTQPLLILRFEADDDAALARIRQQVEGTVREVLTTTDS